LLALLNVVLVAFRVISLLFFALSFRVNVDHKLQIRFHHKGYFTCDPAIDYKRGEVYELEGGWDIDEITLVDFDKLVQKRLGYSAEYKLWYTFPGKGLVDGLKFLKADKDVIRFINEFTGLEYADIYIENTSPDYEIPIEDLEVNGEAADELEEEYASDADYEYSDEGSVGGIDDGDGYSDNDSFDDSDYDEEWQWTNVLPDETVNPIVEKINNTAEVEGTVDAPQSSKNPNPTTISDFEEEDGDSSDLDSQVSSEEECGKKIYPKFKLDDSGVKFRLTQTFRTAELFKAAVKDYALQYRKNVYIKKSDKKRIVVKCTKTCPFHLRASKSSQKNYWQIVSYNDTHKCYKIGKNRQCKTKLVAAKLVTILRHTPNMKLKALQEECKTRWGVMLSKWQVYRAKVKALEMIRGAVTEQYKHLRSYAAELMRSNPNSTVIIKSKVGDNGPVFERMYVCFHACKRAFATTCRPLIGLDGCFLKGTYEFV
jgi:hypothetical protein